MKFTFCWNLREDTWEVNIELLSFTDFDRLKILEVIIELKLEIDSEVCKDSDWILASKIFD